MSKLDETLAASAKKSAVKKTAKKSGTKGSADGASRKAAAITLPNDASLQSRQVWPD